VATRPEKSGKEKGNGRYLVLEVRCRVGYEWGGGVGGITEGYMKRVEEEGVMLVVEGDGSSWVIKE
jgi:hypothetical protein